MQPTCGVLDVALRLGQSALVTASPYEETDDAYCAPSFTGVGVARVALDHQVTLHIGSDSIVIEAPFEIRDGPTTSHVVPGDASQLAGAAHLVNAVLSSVELMKSGELRVGFADGRILTVRPSDDLESWQVFVRGRNMVVCGPDGQLTFLP